MSFFKHHEANKQTKHKHQEQQDEDIVLALTNTNGLNMKARTQREQIWFRWKSLSMSVISCREAVSDHDPDQLSSNKNTDSDLRPLLIKHGSMSVSSVVCSVRKQRNSAGILLFSARITETQKQHQQGC